MKELWNKLPKRKRYALLVKAWPNSPEMHNLEVKFEWDELLVSTRENLERLKREARPPAKEPLGKQSEGQG